MKRINKIVPNFYLETLRKGQPEKWEDVSCRNEIRLYMLSEEQNFQCAYTETRIELENSHIDHYVKQEFIKHALFKPMTVFSWENLFVSCNSEFYGAKFKDKKITAGDYATLVNPAKDSSATHFKYTWTGDIIVENQNEKGRNTVELFNLNDPVLVEQRRVVAYQVKVMYEQFTLQELIQIIGRFESMICFLYETLNN